MSKAEHAARGRSNKAFGDRFEDWIDGQHEMARRLGILAHVEHNQPHSKVIGGRVVYTATGIADYSGVCVGGRAFASEAKSIAAARLLFRAIQPKQAKHLDALSQAGGLAFLLVEFRGGGPGGAVFVRYAIPWTLVPWKTKRTAQSVSMEDLSAEWLVKPGTCYLSKYHAGGPPVLGAERRRSLARD